MAKKYRQTDRIVVAQQRSHFRCKMMGINCNGFGDGDGDGEG